MSVKIGASWSAADFKINDGIEVVQLAIEIYSLPVSTANEFRFQFY
jgi:hypothetical protein